MKIPKLEDLLLNPKSVSPQHIRKLYPEFFDFLNEKFKDSDMKFSEKIYRYFYNINENPKCEVCGKPVKYRNFVFGYPKFCCPACSSRSPQTREKQKNTLINKYGSSTYNNRDKACKTCQERYGCDNPFQAEIVKDKIKSTINERYGVDYPSQSVEIQKTREKNTLLKYGVKHHMMLEEVRNKVLRIGLDRNIKNNPDLLSYTESGQRIMKCPHPKCNQCKEKNYIIDSTNYFARREFSLEPCTRLLPVKSGHAAGTTLELFVRNILDEHNVEYETNVRNIINPYELDIYIPSKKIAIECNGLFWHSRKDMKYHMNKFKMCKDHGIQLLTIWEDQIYNQFEILKSIILSKLNIYNNKIGARRCTIRDLSSDECADFLDKNHLQGETKPQVRLGLIYNNEIISVMTFAKRSALSGSKNNKEWELTRFCNKLNTSIIGGASKLLNHFISEYKPNIITSFASNDISNGGLYETLGFKKEDVTSSYWYIDKKSLKRYHRTRFSKSKLAEMGYTEGTEEEIMKNLPYHKIYDCGHTRYKLFL